MSVESTRETMMKYFSSDHTDVSMMAPDVVFINMATGDETRTPEGVLAMLNFFYHQLFDATATTRTMLFGEKSAMVEGLVVGRHTGEFAGIPATGKEISVPITVVYDLENDLIKQARIYFEVPVLMQQIGAGQAAAAS